MRAHTYTCAHKHATFAHVRSVVSEKNARRNSCSYDHILPPPFPPMSMLFHVMRGADAKKTLLFVKVLIANCPQH